MGKRKVASFATKQNWHKAAAFHQTLPEDAIAAFDAFSLAINDLGNRLSIPPRQMAVAAATLIGTFAMAEVQGDVHDDAGFDEFVVFAQDAVNAMAALVRINCGWRPPGKH